MVAVADGVGMIPSKYKTVFLLREGPELDVIGVFSTFEEAAAAGKGDQIDEYGVKGLGWRVTSRCRQGENDWYVWEVNGGMV